MTILTYMCNVVMYIVYRKLQLHSKNFFFYFTKNCPFLLFCVQHTECVISNKVNDKIAQSLRVLY